jgi:hypothetical protein
VRVLVGETHGTSGQCVSFSFIDGLAACVAFLFFLCVHMCVEISHFVSHAVAVSVGRRGFQVFCVFIFHVISDRSHLHASSK